MGPEGRRNLNWSKLKDGGGAKKVSYTWEKRPKTTTESWLGSGDAKTSSNQVEHTLHRQTRALTKRTKKKLEELGRRYA